MSKEENMSPQKEHNNALMLSSEEGLMDKRSGKNLKGVIVWQLNIEKIFHKIRKSH